ncbi:MAG: cytochrome c oxidase subunit 4 [Chloroflexi bacterium]|nr:cytochrome c oxidase subunit 4 [Chloroflexota bacterium]MCL5110441.1 cytochrome c oxidase subunit 4 [Chloroflexota bacterium]
MVDKEKNAMGTSRDNRGLPHAEAVAHAPRPSLWPLLTALAVSVAIIGLMVNQAVVVVGAALGLVFIIGWGVTGGHS